MLGLVYYLKKKHLGIQMKDLQQLFLEIQENHGNPRKTTKKLIICLIFRIIEEKRAVLAKQTEFLNAPLRWRAPA